MSHTQTYDGYLHKRVNDLDVQIDDKTRLIQFGETEFEQKNNKVYLLVTLLTFTLLILVIFLGRHLGIFTPKIVASLFLLVFVVFAYILLRHYYSQQIKDFFHWIRGTGKHKVRKCKVYEDQEDDYKDDAIDIDITLTN
jgi:Ca2+/Na+ antiporter